MLFLGIDQGGSKTQIAVCDESGNIVGAATGDAATFYLRDPENKSTAIVKQLAEQNVRWTSTSVDDRQTWRSIVHVCGGISGVDWPHEIPIHEERLRSGLWRGVDSATAVNDSIIALRAGSSAPNRCIVVAGTGLNIATHSEDGAEYTYGYFIPYRLGGGGAMGWAVIDAVIEAHAGVRPPTLLTDVALKFSGCANVEEFLTKYTTDRLSQFRHQFLYPGLVESAVAGDAAANEIINDFVARCAAYLEVALTRHLVSTDNAELVFSGGVFKGVGRFVSDALTRILTPKFPRLKFVNARFEPVCGALLMLLDKHYSNNIPPNVIENFETGVAKHNLTRH